MFLFILHLPFFLDYTINFYIIIVNLRNLY
uniref:Uncharacterized protein n=1 Tax=Siphoviridae sp. ctouo22 TaxID=2826463 RepID=A0A8S5MSI2_9CAUD|nr:MAG TPA: hypothetical protein [Siphoviridae sp. ctouo22]